MKIKIITTMFLVFLITACVSGPQLTKSLPTATRLTKTVSISPTLTHIPVPSTTATSKPEIERVLPPDKAFLIQYGTVPENSFFWGIWQFSEAIGSLEPFSDFTEEYNYEQPIWSPDGRRVAYLQVARTNEGNTSIWTNDLASNEPIRIVADIPNQIPHLYGGTYSIVLLGWSMNGQELYYQVLTNSGEWDRLYSVDLVTKTSIEIHVHLADEQDVEIQKWDYLRYYNQTSERLLLADCEGENCDPIRFLIIDLRNTSNSLVINSPEQWRSFGELDDPWLRDAKLSADGKTLAFIAMDSNKDIRVWKQDIDRGTWELMTTIGSSLQSKIYVAYYNYLLWSEDGKWVAAVSESVNKNFYYDKSKSLYLVTINFVETDSWEIKRRYVINQNNLPSLAGWTTDGKGNQVFGAKISGEGLWLLKPDGNSENDLLWIEWAVFEANLPFVVANIPDMIFSWQP